MTYEEILDMIENASYNRFFKGLNYDGLQSTLIECATKIYIAQMQLEKEKLQEEYNGLYECHEKLSEGYEKLSYDWTQLNKENKELRKKYIELLKDSNRNNSEPVEKRMTISEANKLGLLKNDYEEEEKNNVEE